MSVPLAELEVMSTRHTQEPFGTIAFVVRDYMNTATVRSLLQTDWSFVKGESGIKREIISGNILPLQRNEAVQRMQGEFIIFIDDDMTWQPDAIGELVDTWFDLDHQLDEPLIMGGLCFRRTPPYAPTLYMRKNPTDGPYRFLEKWDTDIVEVDATGMAFVLISKSAINAIATQMNGEDTEMPPFELRDRMAAPPAFFNWTGRMGEDLRFCQDAKAAGVRIFVDTRIKVGHLGEIEVGHEHFLQQIAMRPEALERQIIETNSEWGLPTLSSVEAKKELGW